MKLGTEIVLLILPALSSAALTVLIRATYSGDIIAEAQGSEDNIIADGDRKLFQITDKELIKNVEKRYNYTVKYIYVKEPVGHNLISFKEQGFDEIRRKLTPIKATVTERNDVPTTVCAQEFINKSNHRGIFSATITQTVETTASTAWTEGKELGVGAEVSYSVGVASGSASLSFSSSWGTETVETTSTVIGSVSAITVTLEPGQNATANLHATRGEIKAKTDYSVQIHGDVYTVYNEQRSGSRIWGYDITYVQKTCGCPVVHNATETIKFDYFSNARVELV